MTTVLIDNYDSFTWNVYQSLESLGARVVVRRNDEASLADLQALAPVNLVVSPGPGHPARTAGVSADAVRHFAGRVPVLGVCLGEQCIFELYGGKVAGAGEIMHGKTSRVCHDGRGIYRGVPQGFLATRYHSLAAVPATVPPSLEVTSWTESGVIQGVRHRELTVAGVQFHPESIMTEGGLAIFANFLRLRGGRWDENPGFGLGGASAAEEEDGVRVPPPLFPPPKGVPVRGKLGEAATGDRGRRECPTPAAAPHRAGGSVLDRIQAKRVKDVTEAKRRPGSSPEDLRKLLALGVAPPAIDFYSRLLRGSSQGRPAVIGEVKRASPSKGPIDPEANAAELALTYGRAGAAAVSVLTEPKWFLGTLDDLRAARAALSTLADRPALLRKDFISDEYQVLESRLAGADSVLLIVAALADEQLRRLISVSRSLGMEPLVEINCAEEMSRAAAAGARVVGVNNRNLHTFDVDMETTSRLASLVPEGCLLAALSGIRDRGDVERYSRQGAAVSAVLVGEALMRSEDKAAFIASLRDLPAPGAPPARTGRSGSDRAPPLVKICGVRSVEAALAAAEAGADFVGLIFAESKRKVTEAAAAAIVEAVRSRFGRPAEDSGGGGGDDADGGADEEDWFRYHAAQSARAPKPLLVGVFQNQPASRVASVARRLRLDLIQLHGDEAPEFVRLLPAPCIKAFSVDPRAASDDDDDAAAAAEFARARQPGHHAHVLLDTQAARGGAKGGGGVPFDLSLAARFSASDTPFILAGGLTPASVAAAVAAARPWAVDVSSGVETDGEKDPQKIREFVRAAKTACSQRC